jgi:hypothetical protein
MMWSSSKAYTLIAQAAIPPNAGNIGPDDMGTLANAPITKDRADWRLANRDFVTDPDARVGGNAGKYMHYLDDQQKPRWYYDYAYTLMTQQDGAGRFTAVGLRNNGTIPFSHGCWNNFVCHSYATLVLERALGGVCVDTDGDGICDADDNCPTEPNPGQEDGNGDGVGDVCQVPCDTDLNGVIDRTDISAVLAARNTAIIPVDPRDPDGNGIVNVVDARQCILMCTLPRCATP